MKKPNILFLLTDDQSYSTLKARGNNDIITPNMDRICNDGMYFENAYIPGGYTGALCMPSRCMINTGRPLNAIIGNGEKIPNEHITFGEALKNNGYYTYGTGKWHNGPQSFTRSFCGGDNIFFSGMWDHWNVPVCDYDPTGEYDNEINFMMDFWLDNAMPTVPKKVNCDKFNPGLHSSEMVANTVVNFISDYDKSEPFYVYAAFLAPHDPRKMPEKFLEMYDESKLELPKNMQDEHFDYGIKACRDERLAPHPRDEKTVRKELKEYYAMITHLDSEIGRILKTLDDKGIYDDTIIVFCSDNGLAVGCHGLMGKQSCYEHSLKVPLAIKGAGIKKGTCKENVQLMDIYPTIMEYLGFEVPNSVTAKSFCSALNGEKLKGRSEMYLCYSNLVRAYIDGDYKLIEYSKYTRQTQLFNLKEDPNETCDLSRKLEHANVLNTMRKKLINARWQNENENNEMAQEFWRNF